MTAQLPVLAVIVPLLAAPLCFLFARSLGFVWLIAFAASAASFAASVWLAVETHEGAIISYQLGGYPPPLGIEFRIDAANALILLIISAASMAVMFFSRRGILHSLDKERHIYFYICFLLSLSGLMGVAATGDAFNMFVFLEISSLSAYVLIALGGARDRRALTAAYNYLVLGTIGATFFVLGIGFLYAVTGTLNMADLAERIPFLSGNRAVQAGFALILTGLALKIAIFPLHFWLPNAYAFAPTPVTAFLAASATKAAIYALIRFSLSVFGVEFAFGQAIFEFLIVPLAIIGMFAASAVAVFQTDLRRIFAWSSIAQIGFIMLAFGFENRAGVQAAFLHIFNHAFMKAALFMAIGCIALRQSGMSVSSIAGLGARQPWSAAVILLAGASLVGVPLTSGFISKWMLVEAALNKDSLWIAFLFVGASLLTAIYVGKIIQAIYFMDAPMDAPTPLSAQSDGQKIKDAPVSMLAPALLMALATIYFGIDTRFPISMSDKAAEILLDSNVRPATIVLP